MDREIYYKYFEEKIKPLIYPHERERLKTVRKVIVSSILMCILGIIFAYLFIILSAKNSFTILILPVTLFLMYVFFIKSIINVIVKGREFQNSLIQNILPYFLEPVANFKFWPKNRDIETFLNSQIFPDFEAREDELSLFGIYKDANITICNTKLTIPPNKTMFRGITIQLELNKSIDNHIILISKNEYKFNRYKQLNPQIDELNKYLYTFAKYDNTEIITKDFWKCIKNIGEAYTAKSFSLSFENKTVLIAMEQKRPFKFGFLFKTLLKPQNYDELIDMFVSVFRLIDTITKD